MEILRDTKKCLYVVGDTGLDASDPCHSL